ncbi:unnamed protein product, partial [Effrenium voratum]
EIDARAARGDAACQTAAACLQAMRSVICSNKCGNTAAAYFAAVVSTLQRQLSQKGALETQEDSCCALLLILRKAVPAAPSLAAA